MKNLNIGVIYKATNLINGKCYVGKTIQRFKQRKWAHFYLVNHIEKSDSNYYFYRAIRKYGWANFQWEIIGYWPEELLAIFEIHAIKLYESKVPGGYNLTNGGEGISGYKFTKEQIAKFAKANTGKKRSPEQLERQRLGMLGKNVGKKHNEESKRKMREKRKFKIYTQETRDKISISMIEQWANGKRKRRIKNPADGRFVFGDKND